MSSTPAPLQHPLNHGHAAGHPHYPSLHPLQIDSIIYPIAIRFDPRYGDAFWYQDTFVEYIFSMMTSWAIVVDVWYLPPMQRGEKESGVAFAQR